MPMMDDSLDETEKAHILLYGAPKTRKTTWALNAAELGFNVIYADTDFSYHVAKQLSPEARKRIYRLDMRPPEGKFENSGALTLIKAVEQSPIYFNETERKYGRASALNPDHDYALLDFAKFTVRDVLIIDSWTALCNQLALAQKPTNDPTAIAKLEWDDYAKIRLILDNFLMNLTKLSCHVIVVGHSETYAKRRPDADPKAKPNEAVEQIRMQPVSITRAHGEGLAGQFADALYFDLPNSITGTMISTKGTNDFDAGSRTLPPMSKKFDDLQFGALLSPAMLKAVADNAQFSSDAVKAGKGSDFATTAAKTAAIPVGKLPFQLNKG